MKTQKLLITLLLGLCVLCCSCSSSHQVITPLSSEYYCIHGDSVNSASSHHPELAKSKPPKETEQSQDPGWVDYLFTHSSVLPLLILLFGSSR